LFASLKEKGKIITNRIGSKTAKLPVKQTTPSSPAMCWPFTRFIAIAAVCLLADKLPLSAQIVNIPIPDYSFSTDNSGSSYANQYPVDYSPYPTAEIFADWATSSYNYQIYQESTTGQTGSYDGTTAVQVNYPYGPSGFGGPGAEGGQYGSTTESLNPVVASIANNAIYTLTFALANVNGTSGDVTLSMLSTTSAPDTTVYNPYPDPATGQPYGPNPTPTITTQETLASTTISGAVINAQPVGQFTDYSVSFSTVGLNSTYVGQDLTLAINVDGGASTEFDNARLTETTPTPPAPALDLYYDTNGATAGTNTTGSSNLTDSVWTIDPTGSSVTTGYTAGSNIIFSAGSNGTGAQNVTVTDAESVNGITVNNGTVTLLGSGSPSLSIGSGGITNNSTDGPTTLDSSLGTVQVTALQQWNNDSSQALNINSGVSSAGGEIIFDGTGTGATNLNGAISGSINLVQDSTTSLLNLASNSSNFSGVIAANAGATVELDNFLVQNNTVDLNGGTLELNNTANYGAWQNSIVLGPNGGNVENAVDTVYGGLVTGGTTLNVVSGDFIVSGNNADNIGQLNIDAGARLLVWGTGFFNGGENVNVAPGAILDFQINGTLGNAITLASGSALEARASSQTLTDVILPTTGTVTLGSDDVGYASTTIEGPAINLSGPLEIDTNTFINSGTGAQDSTVYLKNQITGSGNLVFGAVNKTSPYDDYSNNQLSTLVLTGNNTYSGTTTLNALTWTDGNNPAQTDRVNMNISLGATGFGTSAVTSNGANIGITTGGTLANNFTIHQSSNIVFTSGSSDLNLTGPIEISGTSIGVGIGNQTSSNLNVGNITFDKVLGNSYGVYFDASGTGGIYLTGTYTSPYLTTDQTTGNYGPPSNGGYGPSSLQFGNGGEENANYYLTPQANFTNMAPLTGNGVGSVDGTAGIGFDSGTLNIENSTWVPGQIIDVQDYYYSNHTVNVIGSQDVNLFVYVNLYNWSLNNGTSGSWSLNQTTADSSTWGGPIQMNGAPLTISVVAGGRLTFTSDMGGGGPNLITKTGAGTVVFDNPNGNDFQSGGTVADIQQGTLIVNSTSGGGFGLGSSAGNINIEAGGTLGGSTTLAGAQQVVAEDSTSVIAPGDPGNAAFGIAPQIGTLSIDGGLTAENGLTMDFKLNGNGSNGGFLANNPGENNDFLEIGTGGMNFGSGTPTVTINLTAIGNAPLLTGTGNFYILIQGASSTGGDWLGNPIFDINTPAGYALDPTFGPDDGLGDGKDLGYIYDTTGDTFYVQLIAVPEPSTYGLLGMGVLGLVAIGRFHRLRRVT
jgi:hypothetical protein